MNSEQIEQIKIGEIFADGEFNCRGSIAPIDVADLSRNIDENGLLQPIIVEEHEGPNGEKYKLIAGYRRHRACQILKWDKVPCIVKKNLTDVQARSINLYENIKRKDLNLLQEAKAIEPWMEEGVTYQEISSRLDVSYGWVQVRATLLKLPEQIQQEAAAGFISQSQIKDLFSLKSVEEQFEAVRRIKDAKASGEKRAVKVRKKKIRNTLNKPKKRDPHEIVEMIDLLIKAFGETSVASRALAWAAGEIPDYAFLQDVEKEAIEVYESRWRIPNDVHLRAKGIL